MNRRTDLSADVVVVGAGASGVPAAIAAARVGARVVLLEEDPVIGGAPCDMYVSMLCGGPITGLLSEAHALLRAKYSILPGVTDGEWFLPGSYQRVWHELISRQPNLSVLTGARVVATEVQEGTGKPVVSGVVVEGSGGSRFTISGSVIIDASGSGAVAVDAGCTAMYGRDSKADFGEPYALPERDDIVQACTWMYISQQLGEPKPFDMTKLESAHLVKVLGSKEWFDANPEAALRANPGIYLHWGCITVCRDTRDPIEVGKAQTSALQQMESDHALLRENGFAIHLAPRIGVRESNRILGEHVVRENDLRSGTLPEDTIAVGDYQIDLWSDDSPEEAETAVPGYGIPYRALVPKDVDGLLLAGKCISGSHIANGAYRVQPIVASIGQAAGVAAALCTREKWQPREAAPEAVRSVLLEDKQHLQLSFDKG